MLKSIIQEQMKLTKHPCHVLTIKDMCQTIEFIRWLFFHKNSVKGCKEIKKDCGKHIVMIEKDCDN